YTLINSEGRYCKIPDDVDVCERCLEESKFELVGKPEGGMRGWRKSWGELVADADTVLCFSENTAKLIGKSYPDAGKRIIMRPHRIDYFPPHRPQVDLGASLRIGVVGDISYAKGAYVVRRIAEFAKARKLKVRIIVVGTIWYEKELPRTIRMTGAYQRES